MKLEVPFYPMPMEHQNYCGQYVLKPIFKYFLDKEFDLEYLSKISEKSDKGFTLTLGLAYAGLREGLKVKFITTSAELVSSEGVPDFEKYHPDKKLSEVQLLANKLLDKSKELGMIFEVRKPGIEELIEQINLKRLIIALIDYGKIYNVDKQIFHFVLLTGYDDNHIYFHDVGPKDPTANKSVDRNLFYKAWSAIGTDMDTAIFSN